jgi:hypothetical protein
MPSTLDLLEIVLQHLDSKPPITTRVLRGTINPSFSAQDDVARLTPRYYAASLSVSSRSPKLIICCFSKTFIRIQQSMQNDEASIQTNRLNCFDMDWHYLGNSGFSRMDPSVRYLQGCFVAMNCDIKYNLTRVPNHPAQV